jgi:glutathione synthase/RimK-type ligase-like ATP-grasp enzyme
MSESLRDLNEANFLMSQYQLCTLFGQSNFALEMQAKALERSQIYRIASSKSPAIRLLAIMAPGDRTCNTPVEYLVQDSDIQLDLLYVTPENRLPSSIPDHDIAMICMCESDDNQALLARMQVLTAQWPRPIINQAQYILRTSRDQISQLLASIPGLLIPPMLRLSRSQIEDLTSKGLNNNSATTNLNFPLTIRPIFSYGGKGLSRLFNASELLAYLGNYTDKEFFVSQFIDYCHADQQYRKIRIVLIEGNPYICHLAISEAWIVHYFSAQMAGNEDKKKEEALFMRNFETDFLKRHGATLKQIAEKLVLQYLVIDCAETQDQKLLIFEVDNCGLVHATDSAEEFPYKLAIMEKVFTAFRHLLVASSNNKFQTQKN